MCYCELNLINHLPTFEVVLECKFCLPYYVLSFILSQGPLDLNRVIQNQVINTTSWLHRASNNVETFLLPIDAHNVKKHRVIKTF